jgi:hypothetical protein
MHILKSLVYFNDVDLADWPVILDKPDLKWSEVSGYIEEEVMKIIKT